MGRADERRARSEAWRAQREAEEAERKRLAEERRERRERERDERVALWRESQGLVTQQAELPPVPVPAPPPAPVQAAFVEEEPPPLPPPPAPAVNNVFDLPRTLEGSFDAFWGAYPRKCAKGDCKKIWSRLRPDGDLLGRMMRALERHKASEQWKREGGQYIPHPSTWLNQQRWEDGGDVQEAAGKVESPPSPDERERAKEALRKRQELLAKLKAVKDGKQADLF